MQPWLLLSIPLFLLLLKLVRGEAIFVPLSKKTIRKMLELAEIKKDDILYDLGCGTGRVIITAAKEYGIKAVGIEKNKILCLICRWNIKRNRVEDRVELIENDFFKENLSNATIVTLYLSQRLNDEIKPKLEKELRKGTRIISADHVLSEWKEVKKIRTEHFYVYLYKI
ncbi:MAG: 50S ribosomal protein L11 methyltransferase [Candidatus Aenigmatarchaeota archaeon]